jgi:hypothetical protein
MAPDTKPYVGLSLEALDRRGASPADTSSGAWTGDEGGVMMLCSEMGLLPLASIVLSSKELVGDVAGLEWIGVVWNGGVVALKLGSMFASVRNYTLMRQVERE